MPAARVRARESKVLMERMGEGLSLSDEVLHGRLIGG
jgi:hypothetical protein